MKRSVWPVIFLSCLCCSSRCLVVGLRGPSRTGLGSCSGIGVGAVIGRAGQHWRLSHRGRQPLDDGPTTGHIPRRRGRGSLNRKHRSSFCKAVHKVLLTIFVVPSLPAYRHDARDLPTICTTGGQHEEILTDTWCYGIVNLHVADDACATAFHEHRRTETCIRSFAGDAGSVELSAIN
jgi:hypothetical protein